MSWRSSAIGGFLAVALAGGCGTAVGRAARFNGPAAPVTSDRSAASTPDPVVLYQLGGGLTIIDPHTGRILQRLGHYRGILDGHAEYSKRNHAVYFIQLRRDRPQLFGLSTRTGRMRHYGPASSFALSPDGRHLAAVNGRSTGVRVIDVGTGESRSWAPANSQLGRSYSLGAVAWLDDSRALVDSLPPATADVASRAGRSAAGGSGAPWFLVSRSSGTVHGRQLRPPALPDAQPVISHDSATPAVWALSRRTTTTVFRLTAAGGAVKAMRIADVHVTLGLALSPNGHRLVYVQRHVRHGNQYTDLDVCRIGVTGACSEHVLVRNAQLGGASWATD